MSLIENIDLGGTARNPDDAKVLCDLGLKFAEITISNPESFYNRIRDYKDIKDKTGFYYLCHGPREGNPNDTKELLSYS